jgi:hypothetical protein
MKCVIVCAIGLIGTLGFAQPGTQCRMSPGEMQNAARVLVRDQSLSPGEQEYAPARGGMYRFSWARAGTSLLVASGHDPRTALPEELRSVAHVSGVVWEVDAHGLLTHHDAEADSTAAEGLRSVAQRLTKAGRAQVCQGELSQARINQWNRSLTGGEIETLKKELEPLLMNDVMSWQRPGSVCDVTIISPRKLEPATLAMCRCSSKHLGPIFPVVVLSDQRRPVRIDLTISPGPTTELESEFLRQSARPRFTLRLRTKRQANPSAKSNGPGVRTH